MNNHAATYNPNGKKYREQAEKGAIGRTAYLRAKSYEDVFRERSGESTLGSLPPHHSRPAGSPPTPGGEKEEDDGNATQWREAR
jgi:hypothetical protein